MHGGSPVRLSTSHRLGSGDSQAGVAAELKAISLPLSGCLDWAICASLCPVSCLEGHRLPKVIWKMKLGKGQRQKRQCLDSRALVSWLLTPHCLTIVCPTSQPQINLINIYTQRVLRCSINCSCDALREPRRKGVQRGPAVVKGANKSAHGSSSPWSFPLPWGFSDRAQI